MRLLVAGSRDYANQSRSVIKLLDSITDFTYSQTGNQDDICPPPNFCHTLGLQFEDITEVVSGCAKGIDTAAILWAESHSIPVKKYPAVWTVDGKTDMAAGFKRNVLMADYCEAAIIIWDGKSRGTKHMMSELDKRGKEFLLWKNLKVRKTVKEVVSQTL